MAAKSNQPLGQAISPWKSSFLTTCLNSDVLKFGTFKLKSGRISPYFFNTALFHRADLVLALANAYAQALISHVPSLDFTVLFGVSHKALYWRLVFANIDTSRRTRLCCFEHGEFDTR